MRKDKVELTAIRNDGTHGRILLDVEDISQIGELDNGTEICFHGGEAVIKVAEPYNAVRELLHDISGATIHYLVTEEELQEGVDKGVIKEEDAKEALDKVFTNIKPVVSPRKGKPLSNKK